MQGGPNFALHAIAGAVGVVVVWAKCAVDVCSALLQCINACMHASNAIGCEPQSNHVLRLQMHGCCVKRRAHLIGMHHLPALWHVWLTWPANFPLIKHPPTHKHRPVHRPAHAVCRQCKQGLRRLCSPAAHALTAAAAHHSVQLWGRGNASWHRAVQGAGGGAFGEPTGVFVKRFETFGWFAGMLDEVCWGSNKKAKRKRRTCRTEGGLLRRERFGLSCFATFSCITTCVNLAVLVQCTQAMLQLRSLRHLSGMTTLQELVLRPRAYTA